MSLALLVDFGSTFTKVALIDLAGAELMARAQAVTTVDSNIMVGLERAVGQIKQAVTGFRTDDARIARLACSSAAGGLRMVAIGLIPSLTLEAARQAALGAGAKIIGSYHHKLTASDMRCIEGKGCDMVLLAGGTDGGDEDCILHNARLIAVSKVEAPIVVAGNRVVAEEVVAILSKAGKSIEATENVLPTLDSMNVEPVRSVIRELFMKHIVRAKGLGEAQDFFGGNVVMPTPMAVLKGAELLARGRDNHEGMGELVVIDVGGATTDVHSIAGGYPTRPGVVHKGVPPPYAQRTVEGDLGIRYNAEHIVEQAGAEAILSDLKRISTSDVAEITYIEKKAKGLSRNIGFVPDLDNDIWLDVAIGRAAVRMAVGRHAATLRPVFTPDGEMFIQEGKDLTGVKTIIGVGGIFSYGREPSLVLEAAVYDERDPLVLKPKASRFLVDKAYMLYAVGLLSGSEPRTALELGRRYLESIDSRSNTGGPCCQ